MRKYYYAMTSCLNRVRQVLEKKDSVWAFFALVVVVVVMVNNQSRNNE